MKKGLVCALAVALMALTLAGCKSKAELPVAPENPEQAAEQASSNNKAAATGDYTLTDAEKLKAMAVGETAVWADYEVTIDSVTSENKTLTVNLTVKSHTAALALPTDCLLSLGMPPTSSSFADGSIAVPAKESVSGTLTFDNPSPSQRLLWNDKAIEAIWLLDPATQSDTPKEDEGQDDGVDDAQKAAVKNIEERLPDLFSNNTYYTFKSVDTETAEVKKLDDGGYSYKNTVSILDGNGDPATVNLSSTWNDEGNNCTSLEMDGTQLF